MQNKTLAGAAVHSCDMAPLIILKDIGLRQQGRELLTDINLRLHPQEIVTLVGPNGAGKTSLVKIILHLVPPTRGTLFRLPNLRIGYMPQHLVLDKTLPLTVQRFLSLSGNQKKISSVLNQVHALKLMHRSMHVLSGGETQRVLLAKALLNSPQLLILDEPSQGVDAQGQLDFYHLIQNVRDQLGCAVLLISHDLHFVHAASDQVICLNGHICCAGSPKEVKENPAYQALFGQDLPPLLVPYLHRHNHRHDTAFAPPEGASPSDSN